MSVLVIGSNGVIGRALVEFLESSGEHVIQVDKSNAHNIAGRKTAYKSIDSIHSTSLQDITTIYHFAGYPSPSLYLSNPFTTLAESIRLLEKVITLAAKIGAHLVYPSSSEVYGDDMTLMQEDNVGTFDLYDPRACYKELKRVSEVMVESARRELGLSATVVRVFNTYGAFGPSDTRFIPSLLRSIHDGTALTVYGDGSQTRSYCYVDDLVKGIITCAEKGENGPINIGNPYEYYTLSEVIEIAESVFHTSIPIVYRDSSEMIGHRSRKPDISRAMSLGFKPTVPLREGLLLTYRKQYGREP